MAAGAATQPPQPHPRPTPAPTCPNPTQVSSLVVRLEVLVATRQLSPEYAMNLRTMAWQSNNALLSLYKV